MSNSPFIKLRPTARVSYLGYKQAAGIQAEVHRTHYCMNIKAPTATVGTEGESKEVSAVLPNQSFKVALGTVPPLKYTLLLCFPLDLCQSVQGLPGTIIVEPGDNVDLALTLKATKKIDLEKLKYFARMYILD